MKRELRALLLANGPLADTVGANVDWGLRDPASSLPALVLHAVSNDTDYTFDGPSGLCETYLTVECWAATYGAADALAGAVRAAVSGLRTSDGIFQGLFIEDQRDGSEYALAVTSFCISLDLRVWHTQA